MSASFFWISWLAASGRPNCLRSSVYWRAVCQQLSAAPSAPQAMRPQPHLAVDGRGRQALHALLEHEAADRAHGTGFADFLGPDHEHVGDGRVADPHLGAAERIAAGDLLGARDHAAGVGAVIGLGQAEAADPFAGGQPGQVLLLLRLGAEFEDRHHHQRRLHAHHRAVARIDALDLARDQPVGDVVQARAAVGLGNGRAEQPELAHLAKDRRVGLLVAERLLHARLQLVLAIRRGGITHHALVARELGVEQEGIVPLKAGGLGHVSSLS